MQRWVTIERLTLSPYFSIDISSEFKRPEPPADDQTKIPTKKLRRNLGDIIHDATKQNKFNLGNSELTRLWNLCPDNLQACRGEDRNFLPPIDSYLETPPDKADTSYEWRALRLLARQSPLFFSLTPAPNKVSEYLENVRKKLNETKTKTKPESESKMDTDNDLMMEKEDGLVEEDTELLKNDQLIPDEANVHKIVTATDDQMRELCVIIGNEWEKLAAKLGKFLLNAGRIVVARTFAQDFNRIQILPNSYSVYRIVK